MHNCFSAAILCGSSVCMTSPQYKPVRDMDNDTIFLRVRRATVDDWQWHHKADDVGENWRHLSRTKSFRFLGAVPINVAQSRCARRSAQLRRTQPGRNIKTCARTCWYEVLCSHNSVSIKPSRASPETIVVGLRLSQPKLIEAPYARKQSILISRRALRFSFFNQPLKYRHLASLGHEGRPASNVRRDAV